MDKASHMYISVNFPNIFSDFIILFLQMKKIDLER